MVTCEAQILAKIIFLISSGIFPVSDKGACRKLSSWKWMSQTAHSVFVLGHLGNFRPLRQPQVTGLFCTSDWGGCSIKSVSKYIFKVGFLCDFHNLSVRFPTLRGRYSGYFRVTGQALHEVLSILTECWIVSTSRSTVCNSMWVHVSQALSTRVPRFVLKAIRSWFADDEFVLEIKPEWCGATRGRGQENTDLPTKFWTFLWQVFQNFGAKSDSISSTSQLNEWQLGVMDVFPAPAVPYTIYKQYFAWRSSKCPTSQYPLWQHQGSDHVTSLSGSHPKGEAGQSQPNQ